MAAAGDPLPVARQPDGPVVSRCLLSTRATREEAAYADWEQGTAEAILQEWSTVEVSGDRWPDPDEDAIIHPWTAEALRAAEDAIQGPHDSPSTPPLNPGEDRQ